MRVFGIDVESCVRCGAAVRVIASIEEPALIERILAQVRGNEARTAQARGPPPIGPAGFEELAPGRHAIAARG